MVSSDHGDVNGSPDSPSGNGRHSNTISELRTPSSDGHSKVGHIEGLRRQFKERAIPEKAGELILASWRHKTNANYMYNFSWRKWEEWCEPRDIHPFSSDISGVLWAFWQISLRPADSIVLSTAISSCHLPTDGFSVGQHPLVSRLLKGAFNLRPPQPKYSHTWEVHKMLDFLKSLGLNDKLTLEQLTRKSVVLLALAGDGA